MCFSHSSTCLQPSGENVFMSLCSSLPNLLTQSKTKIGSQFTLKRKHTVLTFLSLASRGDRRKERKNSWFMAFSGCKKEGKGISVNCSIPNSIKKINIASIYNSCVHHIDMYQSELFLDSGRNNTYLSEKTQASLQMRPDHQRTSIKVQPHYLKEHLWFLEELQRNTPQHDARLGFQFASINCAFEKN